MGESVTNTLASGASRAASRFPIDIDLKEGEKDVQVIRKFFQVRYSVGDVDSYNERFIETLEKIRTQINDDLTLSDHHYKYFMRELRDIGRGAYNSLQDAGIGSYIESLENRESDRGISLDFTFPTGMNFLWQMMYTGSLRDNPVLEDRFWGFRYPIGNLFWHSDPIPRIMLKSGIFASAHKELESSLEELNCLENLLVEIRKKLNQNVIIQRVDDAISCEQVCSNDLFDYFRSENFVYGVVHFACHCVNPERHAAQAYLLMTAKQRELELKLEDFNSYAHEGKIGGSPLVFLNACESQIPLKFLQSLNFPSSLINFGAGSVIATACTMPDDFAKAFAVEFYQRLLKKPLAYATASIGETLLETSCHFLKTKRNPLGLAYGLYAQSNQEFKLE